MNDRPRRHHTGRSHNHQRRRSSQPTRHHHQSHQYDNDNRSRPQQNRAYPISNHRHPSSTTTTDPSSVTISQTSSLASEDDRCAISICCSYLIAIFSSFLVVLGIYLAVTKFELRYLYISLLGLSIEAIGACVYCASNIRSARLTKRKQRIISNEFITNNGSCNTDSDTLSSNIESSISRPSRHPTSAGHIQDSRTLISLSQRNSNVDNSNEQSSPDAIITASQSNVPNEIEGIDEANLLSNQDIQTIAQLEAQNSINQEAYGSLNDPENSGASQTSSIIIITDPDTLRNQHESSQNQNKHLTAQLSDDVVGVQHDQSQPPSNGRIGEILPSTTLLSEQIPSVDQGDTVNSAINNQPSNSTDNNIPSNISSDRMGVLQAQGTRDSQLIEDNQSCSQSIHSDARNSSAAKDTKDSCISKTNLDQNKQRQNDNGAEPHFNEEASSERLSSPPSDQVDSSRSSITPTASPRNVSGLVISGSGDIEAVTRKQSSNLESRRPGNLRRTLVMGLSGEEEIIEIDEGCLDDMSVLPPSYESLAQNSPSNPNQGC